MFCLVHLPSFTSSLIYSRVFFHCHATDGWVQVQRGGAAGAASDNDNILEEEEEGRDGEMGLKPWLENLLPFAAMVAVECLDVGLTTISKSAMSQGMSHFAFVAYSNALATLILSPTLLLPERIKRPPITLQLLGKFFLLGLTGITIVQNCVFTGVNYSSPTLGSAMSNVCPAFTFILAVIFRMEKVRLGSLKSQVKILGTIVSISGALTVTFYKGPSLWSASTPSQSNFHSTPHFTSSDMLASASDWVIGGFFFAVASLSVATWSILQAAAMKGYPSGITVVFFYCLFGAIQCLVVSLIAEREPNAWKLRPDIELGAIVYSAVCGNVVSYGIQTWCIVKRGPVFVSMFKPLGIAVAALLGVIFLGDTLHLGSVVGAVVIVAGFYGVIWAQSKEEEDGEECIENLPSTSQKRPLLHSH
uniref:EamA domain-containing protein n=2 Tax=Kalanchoe fedtschenkoi TaxID=63787 RepID=A0A7N0SWE5_KALFE